MPPRPEAETAVRQRGGKSASSPKVVSSASPAADAAADKSSAAPHSEVDYVPGSYVHASPYAAHPLTWLPRLFFAVKFAVHRLLGLAYLLAYARAWWLYSTDYAAFAASPLPWALPLMGVAQSATAIYYFRFLPKKSDPGYYSDRGTMSYAFVCENLFYSSILMWQWVVMDARFYGDSAAGVAGAATARDSPPAVRAALALAEALWTFLPYALVRPLFPKTRFRDGLSNDGNKTAGNALFLYWGTVITKIFYLWAKWYIGFFFNYLRFLDLISAGERRELYRLLLFSAFATTISVFLHTLKFKGYIGPKTSFGIYMISYLATFLSIVALRGLFLAHPGLVGITAVALVLNRWGHVLVGDRARDVPGNIWQVATMALLYAVRAGAVKVPFAL